MEPTRLFEFIEYQHQNAPLDKAFSTKYEGKWHNISSEEFINKSRAISRALVNMGIKAGDSSDNVPGVPGIGVKTAAELINKYGTLEKLLKSVHEINQ